MLMIAVHLADLFIMRRSAKWVVVRKTHDPPADLWPD